jgi:predicted DNA-binding protein (UPF0251 family)
MARPEKNRLICHPPRMAGFKPFGMPMCEIKVVKIQFDEFESIKLIDYQNLSQDKAAELMNISRPTFTRVYNRALKKIAKAFVEGLAIEIEGGNVEFDRDWYKCKKCHKLIDGLENHIKCQNCTAFGKEELIRINAVF